jgi:hypothetical protein
MPARVFVALLCTDSGRLTASEVATALQGSAGAVSGAVRYLVSIGLVDASTSPVPQGPLPRPARRVARGHGAPRRDGAPVTSTLAEGVTALGPETPAGQRLAETRDFFAFWQREMPPLLVRCAAHRSGPVEKGNAS